MNDHVLLLVPGTICFAHWHIKKLSPLFKTSIRNLFGVTDLPEKFTSLNEAFFCCSVNLNLLICLIGLLCYTL